VSRRYQLLAAVLGVALASPSLSGCMRGCDSSRPPILINPSMFNQPKALPYASSDFFFDGKAMRDPVPGTIARGHLPAAAGEEGAMGDGQARLARGRERYNIYCQPCHDERGEGRGILAERGKVPTRNLLEQKVRDFSDQKLFETITDGFGLMPGYRYPVTPPDRRAIVAYVRSLQAAAPPPPEAAP
jgi:mono/diheme cytochrome c family protein